jgi:hypothetical protein
MIEARHSRSLLDLFARVIVSDLWAWIARGSSAVPSAALLIFISNPERQYQHSDNKHSDASDNK